MLENLNLKIQKTYQKLMAEGNLLSEQQLKENYTAFSSNFDSSKLKALDGELLAETMFNHGNKSSLVYWLEFKSDEEFQNSQFGGIAGGSAFKFGLYKRKEDGRWIAGSPTKSRELSLDEAITLAREKRDMLVKGAQLIDQLDKNAPASDYITLQKELEGVLNGLENAGWVHKYYHMLFPDKIDAFHSADWQKYYLMKMGLIPQGDGRYAMAGQFVELARDVGMSIHYVSRTLGRIFDSIHHYWRIGTTPGKMNYWDEMLAGGYAATGWGQVGDIREYENLSRNDLKQELKQKFETHYPKNAKAIGRNINQLILFVREIKPGDTILAADGETILGIGRVAGEYEYRSDLINPHCMKVEWLQTPNIKLPNPKEGLRTTVYKMKDSENIIEIEGLLKDKGSNPVPIQPPDPLTGIIGEIEKVLARKRQVILYGPPGTGKTYFAEGACFELAALSLYNKSVSMLSEAEKARLRDEGYIRMCSFHPTYGYEDFIEGIKPSVKGDQTVFGLKDGIFKKLCADAAQDPKHNYYLIIDEINRGDISRIFGELITIIESGKRGKEIILPLSGSKFSVPNNVYIIGTMNTADRSIALLDVALRRRFGFIELLPDYRLFEGVSFQGLPLGGWLRELNKRICDNIGQDSRNLQIGHSYFLEKEKPVSNIDKFRRIVKEDVVPLIEEYCYGDYQAVANILGNDIVDVKRQMIKQEIFLPANTADLISALLGPCPELKTSAAVTEEPEDPDTDTSDEMEGEDE